MLPENHKLCSRVDVGLVRRCTLPGVSDGDPDMTGLLTTGFIQFCWDDKEDSKKPLMVGYANRIYKDLMPTKKHVGVCILGVLIVMSRRPPCEVCHVEVYGFCLDPVPAQFTHARRPFDRDDHFRPFLQLGCVLLSRWGLEEDSYCESPPDSPRPDGAESPPPPRSLRCALGLALAALKNNAESICYYTPGELRVIAQR